MTAERPASSSASPTAKTPASLPPQALDHARALAKAGAVAVVGQQWGDEGKGKIVDRLAADFDLVVRYNGGANAGHSVVVEGVRHALHLVPCGILNPGCLNVIGNGVVLDASVLVPEIDALEAAGVPVAERLRISDRAHVVMPYHKRADALYEAAAAASAGDERRIGTTGRGIGPCYADKALRSTAIRVTDLLDEEALRARLRHVCALRNRTLAAVAEHAGMDPAAEGLEPFDPDALAAEALAWAERLAPMVRDTGALLRAARDEGKRLLFEGANAVMLDVDHGTYPFVTSSSPSSGGIYPGTGLPGGLLDEVVGIVKAYATRVGAGPFPTEQDNELGARLRERGREFGTTTGRPRRCGWLDLVALRYACRLSGVTRVSLMLLDVLSGLPELKLCTGYRLGRRELDGPPASVRALETLEPVYETLPGFQAEITDCRRFEDLPAEARAYVEAIEAFLGLPVAIVSVGPDRAQTILR